MIKTIILILLGICVIVAAINGIVGYTFHVIVMCANIIGLIIIYTLEERWLGTTKLILYCELCDEKMFTFCFDCGRQLCKEHDLGNYCGQHKRMGPLDSYKDDSL